MLFGTNKKVYKLYKLKQIQYRRKEKTCLIASFIRQCNLSIMGIKRSYLHNNNFHIIFQFKQILQKEKRKSLKKYYLYITPTFMHFGPKKEV